MSNTDESVTWVECYRRLRRDGHGRLVSLVLAGRLRAISKMDDVTGLSDPDKWRDTTNDQ